MPREKKKKLTRRKDGRFLLRYDGQWFYSTPWAPDDSECYQQKREYERRKKEAQNPGSRMTVKKYALGWLKRTKVGVADQTYNEAATLLDKLLRQIGELTLTEVKASDIKAVYSEEFEGCSNTYIRSGAQLYKALFDAVVDDGYRESNPARQKSAQPHRGAETDGHRAITAQERTWIETLCTDHRAHPAVMAMLYAGIRPQEAKALNIDTSVDFDAGIIHVRESVHMDGSNQYTISDQMKTKFSTRDVPLFPPLRKALLLRDERERARARAKAEKRAKRLKQPLQEEEPPKEGKKKYGMLVRSAEGKPVTVQAWRSVWESYVTEMETAINGCPERWYGKKREHRGKQLPPFVKFTVVPYDLRHSFCTMCRDADPPVELNTCIHWMGHKDAKMILAIYDEYNQDRSKKEAEKLEKNLFGSQNGSQNE